VSSSKAGAPRGEGGDPLVPRKNTWSTHVKRAVDLLVGVMLLCVIGPLLLAVALAIRLVMGPPVLFRQSRPGLGGRPFELLKFRTMSEATDSGGHSLPDDLRLTALGRFLRRFSLDEIPSLFNVLRGDMSLVGPRPLLMAYLPYFTARERLRFDVRPGLTGWAQVNGRNATPWAVRLEHDAWYVEHQSLWLDLRILLTTPARVVAGKDVVVAPRSAMLDLDQERGGDGESRSRPA
jgi:sugar transferase EpsL